MHADLNSFAVDNSESFAEPGADRTFRRMLVLATAILWAANFAILTLMSIAGGDPGWTDLLLPRLTLNLVGAGICYLLHLVLAWAGRAGFRRQLLAAAIATPAGADAYAWCSTYAVWLMHGDTPAMPAAQVILQLALHFWFFASWTGFYLAISYGARLRIQERREASVRILAQAAQLQALHYQISPHFLFNTLNSISSLVADGKNGLAETMVQRLSEFLRLTLMLDPDLDVTLEQELALQNAYLEIERTRFPDMELDVRIAEDVRRAAVPGLILQPLIENAVKHGIATHLGRSTIQISASRAGDRLAVEITNQARADDPVGHPGIGLRNVRERLAARFGDMASLTAGFVRPGRYEAKILMPLSA